MPDCIAKAMDPHQDEVQTNPDPFEARQLGFSVILCADWLPEPLFPLGEHG